MKELEDYKWFPSILRKYQTDFIGYVVAQFNVYDPFIHYLKTQNNATNKMFDLCSGSGEPAVSIFKKASLKGELTLSDKFPNNHKTYYNPISYIDKSIDVLSLKFETDTVYTMYNAFHHFNETEKTNIVQTMINANSKGYFVEILAPDILFYFKILFTTTIGTLILTPFIKPYSLKRILLTYLIPVNVFTITYDGLVSVLNSSSVKEYQKLFSAFNKQVEIFSLKKGLIKLVVIKIN